MELSAASRFLITILTKSIKLLYANLNFLVPITAIHILLSSIFISSLKYSIKTFRITGHRLLTHYPLLQLIATALFLLIYSSSTTSTILVSASSYTRKSLTSQELLSKTKTKILLNLTTPSKISCLKFLNNILITTAIVVPIVNPNFTTNLFATVIGIPEIVYHWYVSVAQKLTRVVSIVEVDCYGKKTAERAEDVVEGKRVVGFLMNMLITLITVMLVCGYWSVKGFQNIMMFMHFAIYCLVLLNILSSLMYTVFYFECKKCRDEDIERVEDYGKVLPLS